MPKLCQSLFDAELPIWDPRAEQLLSGEPAHTALLHCRSRSRILAEIAAVPAGMNLLGASLPSADDTQPSADDTQPSAEPSGLCRLDSTRVSEQFQVSREQAREMIDQGFLDAVTHL